MSLEEFRSFTLKSLTLDYLYKSYHRLSYYSTFTFMFLAFIQNNFQKRN